MSSPKQPWSDDSGATMVEYALVVSFIAAVAIAAVRIFGRSVLDLFRLTVAAIASVT